MSALVPANTPQLQRDAARLAAYDFVMPRFVSQHDAKMPLRAVLSTGGRILTYPKCRYCAKPFRMVPLGYTWTWEPTCFCPQPVNLTTITSATTEGTETTAE